MIDKKQIEAWKKEHYEVFKIEIEVKPEVVETTDKKAPKVVQEKEMAIGYVRGMTRQEYESCLVLAVDDKSGAKVGFFILDCTWLGGDQRIKTREQGKEPVGKFYVAAALQCAELFDFPEATISPV